MLATSIDTLPLPPAWHPLVEQIRVVIQPPPSGGGAMLVSRYGYIPGTSSIVTCLPDARNGIEQLGWSPTEALETLLRFRGFAEDWDAPGMEAYDDL